MTENESTNGDGHIPHSSADDIEYVDERNIRIFKSGWTCPNCGDDGELMFRPGSKSTCAECFWVVNGRFNELVLDDWPMKYRQAQKLLVEELDDKWHGTPGDIASRLWKYFDRPEEAARAVEEMQSTEIATDGGPTTLDDYT